MVPVTVLHYYHMCQRLLPTKTHMRPYLYTLSHICLKFSKPEQKFHVLALISLNFCAPQLHKNVCIDIFWYKGYNPWQKHYNLFWKVSAHTFWSIATKRVPQAIPQTLTLIKLFYSMLPFSSPTPNDAVFTLFVNIRFSYKCVSHHSI